MNNPRRAFLTQVSVMAGTIGLSKPIASAAALTGTSRLLFNVGNFINSDKQKNGLIPKYIIPRTPLKSFVASFADLSLAKHLPV